MPGAARAGGHGGLRRAARGDRARRLPGVDPRGRGLRMRRRHPLDRPVGLDGDRRARPRAAGGCRAGALPATGSGRGAVDAEHRRGVHAALRGRRADRPRSGVRAHRVLLRAGHARRDPRRPRLARPAGRPRRPAPPHAGAHGPLPGLLLRGGARVAASSGGPRERRRRRRRPGRARGGARARPARRARRRRDRARARAGRHPAPRRPPGLRAARPAPAAVGPGLRASPGRARAHAPAQSSAPRRWSRAGHPTGRSS